jgi:hypothetical protein
MRESLSYQGIGTAPRDSAAAAPTGVNRCRVPPWTLSTRVIRGRRCDCSSSMFPAHLDGLLMAPFRSASAEELELLGGLVPGRVAEPAGFSGGSRAGQPKPPRLQQRRRRQCQ